MKVIWIFRTIKWLGLTILEGGGVCIYFKKSLSIRYLDVPSNLEESLLCELHYKNNKCFIATLYRSPSQTRKEFENFLSNFEVLNKNNIQSKRRNPTISNQKDVIQQYPIKKT